MKKINFFAGPSILDESILREATDLIYNKKGLSLLEISHRSDKIVELFEETKALIYDIMQINRNKEVLFLHGGASLQFAMTALNITRNGMAGFVDTGIWTKKAIIEAKKVRPVQIIASSEQENYSFIPSIENSMLQDLDYLHLCSNNTIYGTQYQKFPKTKIPLVVDMSSDILSRQLDFDAFDVIFAGLQKNLGTAGGCLVILDKKVLNQKNNNLLSMLDYKVHIEKQSMFNTPPVFAVLLCNLSLKWIKKEGGLAVIEKRNEIKSDLLYDEIERNKLFECPINKSDRSMMNVCFDALNSTTETAFLQKCEQNNIVGIKGHRNRGGFRASLYNAMPIKSVRYLVEIMQDFEKSFA